MNDSEQTSQLSKAELDLMEVMEDAMKPIPSFSSLDNAAEASSTIDAAEPKTYDSPPTSEPFTTNTDEQCQNHIDTSLDDNIDVTEDLAADNNEAKDEGHVPDKEDDGNHESTEKPQCVAHSAREVLRMFYSEHNPSKISTIDLIVQRFEGKEVEMLESLKEKYNIKEHPVIDSYLQTLPREVSNDAVATPESSAASVSNTTGSAISGINSNRNSSNSSSTTTGTLSSTISGMYSNIPTQIFSLGSVLGTSTQTTNASSASSAGATSNTTGYNSIPSRLSSSALEKLPQSPSLGDEKSSALMARIEALQSAMAMLEAENHDLSQQTKKQKQEIQQIVQSSAELELRNESLEKRLEETTSRELSAKEEVTTLQKQLNEAQEETQKLSSSLESCIEQRNNKHEQLLEVIDLNHRMEAQVQYLAIRAFENINFNDLLGTETNSDEVVSVDVKEASENNEEEEEKQLIQKKIKEFDSLADKIPEIAELRQQMGLSFDPDGDAQGCGEVKPLELRQVDELVDEIITLRKYNHVIRSSFMASRVELRQAVKQASTAERCTIDQHALIEELEAKLANERATTGSADDLQQQIVDAKLESEDLKLRLENSEREIDQLKKECNELNETIRSLNEEIYKVNIAREDISNISRQQILETERRANEFVSRMRETILFEREEITSQIIHVKELQQQVGAAISLETQKELQRLRDELIKSRRIETQKDREVSFLQRQLTEAAKRIAESSYKQEHLESVR